jgi:hypothetical protein
MSAMIGGLSFFSRTSGGDLKIAGYHPRSCPTWHWSVVLIKSKGMARRAKHRRGQWHDYYWLPFGWRLIVSQQDWHRLTTDH